MKTFFLFTAAMSLTLSFSLANQQSQQAQADNLPKVLRTVKGQTLTSPHTPALSLKFDKAFKYAGSQAFVLYEVANAEQHFFLDADDQGRVKRMYWVQFEGYLPANTHVYRYKVNRLVNIAGLDFIADAYARNLKEDVGRPESDGNRARAFLASKGYRMASDDLLLQRLVHLVDETKRNELMIIYIEDLSSMNLTARDLRGSGSAASRWNEIAAALLERAQKGIKILR